MIICTLQQYSKIRPYNIYNVIISGKDTYTYKLEMANELKQK